MKSLIDYLAKRRMEKRMAKYSAKIERQCEQDRAHSCIIPANSGFRLVTVEFREGKELRFHNVIAWRIRGDDAHPIVSWVNFEAHVLMPATIHALVDPNGSVSDGEGCWSSVDEWLVQARRDWLKGGGFNPA
jgi:hypothetical protein